MISAARTWALVIGIDVYSGPGIPTLPGPSYDVIAAVGWLRALGVPDDQILLHASPRESAASSIEDLGLSCNAATSEAIGESAQRLKQNSGERLFVFLSGHGIYEPTKGRLFLTQEAKPGNMANLGIDKWIAYFRSLPYEQQFLIMDGCLNYPYSPTERSKINSMLYGAVEVPTPLETTSMIALFAASPGQVVKEIGDRGPYLRRFFEYANPKRPLLQAVALDFETGRRLVPARLLHGFVGRAASADVAALQPPVPMNPGCIPYGRAESLDDVTLFELADEATSAVTLNVHPVYAHTDVESLRLHCVRSPYWETEAPGDPAYPYPAPGRQPAAARA